MFVLLLYLPLELPLVLFLILAFLSHLFACNMCEFCFSVVSFFGYVEDRSLTLFVVLIDVFVVVIVVRQRPVFSFVL